MGILSFFRRRTSAPEKSTVIDDTLPSSKPTDAPQKKKSPSASPSAIHAVHPDLLEPVVTEKSSLLASEGHYTFRVTSSATKQDVRYAVEGQYRVHVTGVRMIRVQPKTRIRGRIIGEVSGYRKAIVSLRQGEHIDLTSEVR